jgi:hypothetical protein
MGVRKMIDCIMGEYNSHLIEIFDPPIKGYNQKALWVVEPTHSFDISLPITLANTVQNIAAELGCSMDEAINTCAWHGSNVNTFPKIDEEEIELMMAVDKLENLNNKIVEIGLRLGVVMGTPVRKQVSLSVAEEQLTLSRTGTKCKNYLKIVGNNIVELAR